MDKMNPMLQWVLIGVMAGVMVYGIHIATVAIENKTGFQIPGM